MGTSPLDGAAGPVALNPARAWLTGKGETNRFYAKVAHFDVCRQSARDSVNDGIGLNYARY